MGTSHQPFRKSIAIAVISAAAILGGCRSSPKVGGVELESCVTGGCPEGLRCIDGNCLSNSLPFVAPIAAAEVVVGGTIELIAEAGDVNTDDVLTITWRQIDESPHRLMTEPQQGAQLSLTPLYVGSFVLQVIANDGFDNSAAVDVALKVTNYLPTLDGDNATVRLDLSAGAVAATIRSVPDDSDSHAVAVRWAQVGGPDLDLGEILSDSLVATISELGLYTFEATPHDGFEAGLSKRFAVLGQPGTNIVYVSDAPSFDTSATSDDCGDFDSPCANINDGLLRAGAMGSTEILVAANATTSPYHTCLDLPPGVQLWGGFRSADWAHDAQTLRSRTRIECEDTSGAGGNFISDAHTMQDGSILSDVTLALAPRIDNGGGFSVFSATLLLHGEKTSRIAPQVERVNIEVLPCGPNCLAAGVLSVNASPTLLEVDVGVSGHSLEVVDTMLGMMFMGGSPTISGQADQGGRGVITLNAPVTESATGIFAGGVDDIESNISISGIVVEGGLGPQLQGIALFGVNATVQNSVIDLRSFGTVGMSGIIASPCEKGVYPCLDIFDPTVEPSGQWRQGRATLLGNTVTLGAGQGSSAQPPCSGLGIGIGSSVWGQRIENNDVHLAAEFSFAVGTFMSGTGNIAPVGATPNIISGGSTVVNGGRVDPLCLGRDGSESIADTGAIGVLAFGDLNEVRDTDISVGMHSELALGLAIFADENGGVPALRAHVEGNSITVGIDGAILSDTGRLPTVAGALLQRDLESTVPAPSIFSGNSVWVGGRAGDSAGVSIIGVGVWEISDNFIYGGEGMFSVGLLGVFTHSAPTPYPWIVHNTIHGGGWAGSTATSTAAVLFMPNAAAKPSGQIVNNLFDAGAGKGRRRPFAGMDSSAFVEFVGNTAQFVGPQAHTRPLSIEVLRYAGGKLKPVVVLAGAATAVVLKASGTSRLAEFETAEFASTPVATWTGTVGTTDWIVTTFARAFMANAPDISLDSIRSTTRYVPPSAGCEYTSGITAWPDDTGQEAAVLMERCATTSHIVYVPLTAGVVTERAILSVGPNFDAPSNLEGDAEGRVYVADGTTVYRFDEGGLGDDNDAHQGARIDFGTGANSITETITRLWVMELEDSSSASEDVQDLLFIAGGRAHVVKNAPFSASGTPVPVFRTFKPEVPCLGADVTAMSVGLLDQSQLTRKDLMVACSDQRVQLYYNDGLGDLRWLATFAAGASYGFSDIAVLNSCEVATQECHVITIDNATDSAQLLAVNITGSTRTIRALGGEPNLTFLGDAASPGHVANAGVQYEPDFSVDPTLQQGVQLFEHNAAQACALGVHDSGDPADLHLVGAALTNPCIDSAGTPNVTYPNAVSARLEQDVDGETRPDQDRDVGADETP